MTASGKNKNAATAESQAECYCVEGRLTKQGRWQRNPRQYETEGAARFAQHILGLYDAVAATRVIRVSRQGNEE